MAVIDHRIIPLKVTVPFCGVRLHAFFVWEGCVFMKLNTKSAVRLTYSEGTLKQFSEKTLVQCVEIRELTAKVITSN